MDVNNIISYIGVTFIIIAVLLPTSIQLRSAKKHGNYKSMFTKLGNKDKKKSKIALILFAVGLSLLALGIQI